MKAQRRDVVEFHRPFGYFELRRAAARLRRAYPNLAVFSIGSSVLGKPLYAFRLGTGTKRVFVNGAFHANEWITAPLVLRFVEEAARAAQRGESFRGRDAAELFRRVTLDAVPMVNPDGVELVVRGLGADHPLRRELLAWNGGSDDFSGWKANARGVDLNDQFPAHWDVERDRRAVDGPGPRDYTGEAPLTEPEAQAIARFTEAERFDLVVAMHTQGREIYWNYRDREPLEAERIARALGRASGYAPVKLTGSDAGYKDWFIDRFGRPGFTVEAGFGANPLPLAQLPGMYEETSALLMEALLASLRRN
ncbi:M14 family metallocarboxypeptidase [Paenibacillus sp.]|uniref:M14 family metallopeptidase n=1 Tax=Paenibacillus sp. TaxID=58172 RepID=UPI002D40CA4D|nr:M14 family metallocarboxypeptidase [Paenibacillus sp.]HZG87159.1 M14 family metallocarboxypeptidase [Paenibacillus sp.]